MIDKDFEKLLEKCELVVIPTDSVMDLWQDNMGFVRLTIGIGKKSQHNGNIMIQFCDRDSFHMTDDFDKYMDEAKKAANDGLFNAKFVNGIEKLKPKGEIDD